jgi:hypothetical protein
MVQKELGLSVNKASTGFGDNSASGLQAGGRLINGEVAAFFVRLYPELSVAALKVGLDKELALWYELRAINVTGCGRLVLNDAVALLVKNFGYSVQTLYRLLKAGDSRLWDICHSPRSPGCSVVKIKGLSQVVEWFNIPGVSRPVEIRAQDFIGRQVKTAWLYASFFKPDGSRAKPISRDSVKAATGVKRRQQRRYDQVAGIKRVANFAFRQEGQSVVGMVHLVSSKTRQWKVLRRLGNTYHSRALKAHRGMTKKVNELRQRSLKRDEEARLPKRFFLSAGSLIGSSERDKEAFILVNKRDRLIKGRMEWCIA